MLIDSGLMASAAAGVTAAIGMRSRAIRRRNRRRATERRSKGGRGIGVAPLLIVPCRDDPSDRMAHVWFLGGGEVLGRTSGPPQAPLLSPLRLLHQSASMSR